jgi:Uma2 family endonuclease
MASILFQEKVRVPRDIDDLDAFRRWAHSDEFPEHGRFAYLAGDIWVDLSMEQLFSHNQVKTRMNAVLSDIAVADSLGYDAADGMFLSIPAVDLATIPDGVFASYETVRSGRVQLVEGIDEGFVELAGVPDMVLEVVSEHSVRKDTVTLRELYWKAGIPEYWLVDARKEPLQFDVLRRGARGYVATRRQAGWLKSAVFGRSFQLTLRTDPLGHPQSTLAIRA